MKEKVWYEVKVNGETLAKVKSKGLAYHVKQKFEDIYTNANTDPCCKINRPIKVTVE